jgi:hypothetical protein
MSTRLRFLTSAMGGKRTLSEDYYPCIIDMMSRAVSVRES